MMWYYCSDRAIVLQCLSLLWWLLLKDSFQDSLACCSKIPHFISLPWCFMYERFKSLVQQKIPTRICGVITVPVNDSMRFLHRIPRRHRSSATSTRIQLFCIVSLLLNWESKSPFRYDCPILFSSLSFQTKIETKIVVTSSWLPPFNKITSSSKFHVWAGKCVSQLLWLVSCSMV